ncbi:MAG: hypothetical protein ABI604_17140 [Nitrospirota bacterium]
MLIAEHLNKVQRMRVAHTRLDATQDCELWLFVALAIGVHAINAAMHSLGATIEERCFPYNIPVYVVPRKDPVAFNFVIRPFGDIEHVDGPEMEALIPEQLEEAKVALLYLEQFRDPIVRSSHAVDADILRKMEYAFETCLNAALSCISDRRGVS